MKISSLTLKNFRAYSNVFVKFDDNFNVIIGRNDVGKSTILEALEIFFNNETVKIDIGDHNVHVADPEMSIQVSFSPDDKQYTIDTVPTDLHREYLLDENGELTIKKSWDCSKDKLTATSLKTYIIANYPKVFEEPLISLKIADLKKMLDSYGDKLDVKEVKKNKSSSIRQAIYEVEDMAEFSLRDIPIDKEDGKKIWDSLKLDLPLFFIFQSDRANKDSDKKVQDPLKAITKTAIGQLEQELEKVKEQIRIKAENLGNRTLEKLKEMNPEIAEVLTPQMTNKAWDSLFSFSFNCDDGIPINKRGSGVRRLILLNYFRAEAERKNSEERNVIYAIEEPETSQHPDWQVELFNALVELSENPSTQVLITTHSPSLAGLVCPDNILFVYKNEQDIKVKKGGNDNLQVIADTLGLLPNVSITLESNGIKAILCVEGPSDIEFFNHIGKLFGIDLENDGRVLVLCLGGGTLMHWVNKNYLAKLNKPEIHIYDNDVSKYQLAIDEVNARGNGWGTLTNMCEMENYIHPSLISQVYHIQEEFFPTQGEWQEEWSSKNIPKELSSFLKQLKANGNNEITDEGQSSIKRILSSKAAPLMTVDLLKDLSAYDEVNGWFEQLNGLIQ
ncbi:ATP-binding protein [Shewanella dokdonensis]|uniref:ATP-binding protein n=1 Tax=Shewanella dokdonensis TaxID=712036 RepID=A0ABX8DCH4_9GAMM|nr:ATP-binding protein [Shewanella dokdonensis]MCL1074558.1 ATP-binding protein [Shewanella dokdonensis]QVK22421.1 ATP-binding protein [Shewanella dokdonensis]